MINVKDSKGFQRVLRDYYVTLEIVGHMFGEADMSLAWIACSAFMDSRPDRFGKLDAPCPDEIQLEHVLQAREAERSGKNDWMTATVTQLRNCAPLCQGIPQGHAFVFLCRSFQYHPSAFRALVVAVTAEAW